jgi:polar amino acid transport system substrate-binding protein
LNLNPKLVRVAIGPVIHYAVFFTLTLTWNVRMPIIILILSLVLVQMPSGINAQDSTDTAPVIISGHPDRRPLAYQNSVQIVGFFPDLAGVVLSNLGVVYENRFIGPWKRVQELARQGKVDMLAGIYRNSERETYLVFSESFFDDPTSVFVKKDRNIAVSNKQDLIGLRGVTLFGDSYGEQLDHFIVDHLRMVRVYSTEEMFDLLLSEKVDYMIFGHYAGRVTASQMGIQDQIVVAKKKLVVENIYFAFSKKSPHIHLLPGINRELRKLREEGYIDTLIDEYMERYLLKAN